MNLTISHLSFSYGGHAVLKDLSFSAQTGQVLVIMGANGAGKTTLLNCLAGLLPVPRGTITLQDLDLSGLSSRQRAQIIAWLSQKTELPDTTVFQTVLMGRIPHFSWQPSPQDLNQVHKALEQVGITHLAMRKASELSGGEQQLVALARALAQEPKLLLCDEPTSNLDLKAQLNVCQLLKTLARKQHLNIVVTLHDINLALRMADRLLFIHDQTARTQGDARCVNSQLIHDIYGIDADIIETSNHQRIVVPC